MEWLLHSETGTRTSVTSEGTWDQLFQLQFQTQAMLPLSHKRSCPISISIGLVVKNLPTNTGDIRDAGSIPGLGRSPGRGNGYPLQYSCLENPMDREAWQAIKGLQRVGQD